MSGALAAEAPRSPKRARLDGERLVDNVACAVAAAPAATAGDEAEPQPRPLLLRRHVPCVPRPTPNAAQLRIAAALAAAPPGPDPRFVPGDAALAAAAAAQGAPAASFVLELRVDGFALRPPGPPRSRGSAEPPLPLHPYDRSTAALLADIDAGRIPGAGMVRTLEALQPLQWWEGHLACDVHDWRPLEAAARAAPDTAAPSAPTPPPTPRRVLLRQSGDALNRDARELASRYVPFRRRQLAELRGRDQNAAPPSCYEEQLVFAEATRVVHALESRILLAQYPALQLSPEPARGGCSSSADGVAGRVWVPPALRAQVAARRPLPPRDPRPLWQAPEAVRGLKGSGTAEVGPPAVPPAPPAPPLPSVPLRALPQLPMPAMALHATPPPQPGAASGGGSGDAMRRWHAQAAAAAAAASPAWGVPPPLAQAQPGAAQAQAHAALQAQRAAAAAAHAAAAQQQQQQQLFYHHQQQQQPMFRAVTAEHAAAAQQRKDFEALFDDDHAMPGPEAAQQVQQPTQSVAAARIAHRVAAQRAAMGWTNGGLLPPPPGLLAAQPQEQPPMW